MAKAQVNACAACGCRARRICPALAGMICPTCCGNRRGTKIECPPDCSYFPFGTAAYGLWLKIDAAWQPKALNYVIGKIGKGRIEAAAKQLAPSWLDGDHAFNEGVGAALLYYLAVNEGDDLPVGEIWKEEGWPGLNNDERFMAEYRAHSLPGVLEVQRVLNDTAVECIDLLDPDRGKFVVFDRGTATTASRFTTMIVWLTHYPHFTRLAGNGVIVPNELSKKFLSAIRERADETFKNDSDEAVKRYLAESFGRAADLVKSLIDEKHDQIIASLDADQCAASYEFRVPREDIEIVLNEKPDFEAVDDWDMEPGDPPDTCHYAWLRRGEAKRIEEDSPGLIRHDEEDDSAVGGLGMVRLTNDDLTLTTMGRQKFAFAKELVATYFKDKLELVDEKITPLETLMAEAASSDQEHVGPSKKIPADVEAQIIQEFYAKQYNRFLDEPVPMIDNMTPRQAAQLPSMRPKLIDLIKLHLNKIDTTSVEKGIDIDIDWILDELGLDELR